jgi:hypothetical protein
MVVDRFTRRWSELEMHVWLVKRDSKAQLLVEWNRAEQKVAGSEEEVAGRQNDAARNMQKHGWRMEFDVTQENATRRHNQKSIAPGKEEKTTKYGVVYERSDVEQTTEINQRYSLSDRS